MAVVGTGLRRTYPADHAELAGHIADSGAVVSQFWPDAPPTRTSFPMRNIVMSGIALATVVIEASERSGARMQARLALEHGRRVFLHESLLEHDWASEYAERPGTTVVSSAADAVGQVERLTSLDVALTLWARRADQDSAMPTVVELSDPYANFLRTPPAPDDPDTCSVCLTFTEDGFSRCYRCNHQPRAAEAMLAISFSVHMGQLHTALRGYKEGWPSAERRAAQGRARRRPLALPSPPQALPRPASGRCWLCDCDDGSVERPRA